MKQTAFQQKERILQFFLNFWYGIEINGLCGKEQIYPGNILISGF